MSTILVSVQDDISLLIDKSNEPTIISVEEPTVLQSTEEPTYLITTNEVTSILHTGITGPTGPAGPTAGVTEQTEPLPIIGSGTGASKTTTEIEGNVIYESFGVGDEVLVTWLVPDDIERNFAQGLTAHMFNTSSEAGTFSSWEINITTHNTDGSHIMGTLYFIDAPMPHTAFVPTNGTLELSAGVWIVPLSNMVHLRIKRIASSNDPSADVGMMFLYANYTSDGRVGATGADGAPGGEDEVAQAKRIDFTANDTIIYKGEASPGTPDASAFWRLRRLTIASDNDVIEEWADGVSDYTKVWDNHLTYTYS